MGYVWCEIRQQSSEEPCDETSFGKKNSLQKSTSREATKNTTRTCVNPPKALIVGG